MLPKVQTRTYKSFCKLRICLKAKFQFLEHTHFKPSGELYYIKKNPIYNIRVNIKWKIFLKKKCKEPLIEN